MHRRAIAFGLVVLCGWSVSVAQTKWLRREVLDRVSIFGQRTLSYHIHEVSGDRDAFETGNFGGLGGQQFTDMGFLSVSGRQVLGMLSFDFDIHDRRFRDPQGERFSIDMERYGWTLNLGDVRGSLPGGNRFSSFNKTLRGAMLGYSAGDFSARAVVSESKGAARTVSFQGANISGPYFLQSNQILRGSETVMIDDAVQTLGSDYIIDYEVGSIHFVNRATLEARIIPPTSTVTVTYEALGVGDRGRIEGLGASYNLGSLGRIGVNVVRQLTGGGDGRSTRLEKFEGFGPPSTPYFLQFEPQPGTPVVVRADGVLQTEGFDFRFDPNNRSIFYFNRFMPHTTHIDVLYTPRLRATVAGDRETVGFDWNLPLGSGDRSGTLRYSQAIGRAFITPTPRSGVARGADLRWSQPGLVASASVRDVPEGYVSVETLGFSRNERASEASVQVRPNPRLTYGLTWRNASVASRVGTELAGEQGTAAEFRRNRFVRTRLYTEFRPDDEGRLWTLSHSRNESRNAFGEQRLDSTELSTSHRLGRLSFNLGLQHSTGSGPVSVGQSVQQRGVRLGTMNLSTSYDAGAQLRMRANVGLSDVNAGGERGTGRDWTLGASYTPNPRLNATLQMSESDAGALATLGPFGFSTGAGFDGNGFSGGLEGRVLTGASRARSQSIGVDWRATDRLNLNMNLMLYRAEGSVSSNAETRSGLISGDWDLGRGFTFSGQIAESSTQFVGTGLQMRSTSLLGFLDASPPGRWSFRLGASAFLSGGEGEFAQDIGSLEGSVSHRLAPRQSLHFSLFTNSTRGYLPQDDLDWSLGYQYQIWQNLALSVRYRTREVRNLDPFVTSGAYQSRGFSAELVFNFGM